LVSAKDFEGANVFVSAEFFRMRQCFCIILRRLYFSAFLFCMRQ
jgi:hypothetical protein